MDANELTEFSRRAADQLSGHILPFWSGPAVDPERGGWMGWLSNDLKPDRSQPKGLIVHARILWAFSAACQRRPERPLQEMADRAHEFLMDRFWDDHGGGAFWRLDDQGRVLDDSKKIYGQAFCIYALVEYFRAFQSCDTLDRAIEVFYLLERHAHDAKHGGYWEVLRRDWSEAAPGARLSDKDLNEKKSMNNHLHVLEAFTNLYRVWPNPRVALRLRELLRLFQERILDARTGHFHHFFDEAWNVRSDTYTFGHDIEGSWLLCEAAQVLGDAARMEATRATALRMAEAVLREGVASDGALYYEGKNGEVIDRGKEWWPQAEAVVGFLNAYQISGHRKFFEASRRAWDFIEQNLVDRVHGEWFWRVMPDGKVDAALPKVSEWKGPYHGGRACLEILRRLEILRGAGDPAAAVGGPPAE